VRDAARSGIVNLLKLSGGTGGYWSSTAPCPPILARTVDVAKRPDWPSIRADIQTVRAGSAPVSPTGYPLAPPDQTLAAATPETVTRW
jgi:hypothetical protein